MDNDKKSQPIIIKRIKKHKHEEHGGAWKIAYADFVTAMMAFFMLMWLLSLLNKYQLQGVSEYFKRPLKSILTGSNHFDEQKTTTLQNILIEDNDQRKVHLIYPVNQPSTSPIKPAAIGTDDNPQGKQNDIDKNKDKDKDKNKDQDKSKSQASAPDADSTTTSQQSSTNAKKQAAAQMEQLKNELEIKLQSNPALQPFAKNLNFQVTDDGLKISLHDTSGNPMFEVGGAKLKHASSQLITWLSTEFNRIPKKMIIIGHTDSIQYGSIAGYSNWELSANRANAARQVLVQSGMHGGKVLRTEGASDLNPYNKKNPYDPMNRRVDIVILNDKAANKLMNE